MDFLIELLLEIFGELFLEIFGQLIGEAIAWLFTGQTPVDTPPRRRPWIVLHVFAGLVAGVVSADFFPNPMLRSLPLQIGNLLLAPFLLGWLAHLAHRWLRPRVKRPERIPEGFLEGYALAFAFALTRLVLITRL